MSNVVDLSKLGVTCLYFGNPEECQSCGGWVKAEGGPFPGDPRYCSEDCFADAQERAAEAESGLHGFVVAQNAVTTAASTTRPAPHCSGRRPR